MVNVRTSVCLLSLFTCVLSTSAECLWNTNKNLPEKDPVFLKKIRKNYQLFKPDSTFTLKRNQVLYAACPGSKNHFVETSATVLKLSCVSEGLVKVNGSDIRPLSALSCHRQVTPTVITSEHPDSALSLLRAGFNTEFGFQQVYTIFYDFTHNTPVYTRHEISGDILKDSYKGNATRPSFKTDGIANNIAWSKIFSKNHQRDILTKSLGSRIADKYLDRTYLARGHLAPDADFHFHSWELATYFLANVVPQWQSINSGNWLRIENAVRHKTAELGDVTVTTGAEGVLTVKVEDNNVPIYLAEESVPVPKYLWKILCAKDRSCIAFVVANDPVQRQEGVCTNICSRNYDFAGWYLSSFDKIEKGIVECCDVRELSKIFKTVPAMEVKDIIRF